MWRLGTFRARLEWTSPSRANSLNSQVKLIEFDENETKKTFAWMMMTLFACRLRIPLWHTSRYTERKISEDFWDNFEFMTVFCMFFVSRHHFTLMTVTQHPTSLMINENYATLCYPCDTYRYEKDRMVEKWNSTTLNIRKHFSTFFLHFNDVWDFILSCEWDRETKYGAINFAWTSW